MSTSIAEYLDQLDERRSLEVLQKCYSQKASLIFKADNSAQMIKANIDSFSNKKVILKFDQPDVVISEHQAKSIKFNIGTEVFFTKVLIKRFMNNYYFDISAQVIKLKRRQETRYFIPKKWPQSANIVNYAVTAKLIPCQIHDISASGIRIETSLPQITFSKEDLLHIRFSIYKRAEIRCEAVIHFILQHEKMGSILGLEFVMLKPLQREKIQSLVDDIIQFTAINKF